MGLLVIVGTPPPRSFPCMVDRPVSGLASLDPPPSHGFGHSGYRVSPHLLTVAGAAQVSHLFPVSPRPPDGDVGT